MPDTATITREQLRTTLIATELGGQIGDSSHFSYAALGKSTYSFGQMQFDVGNNHDAQEFLRRNGFDDNDIGDLSSRGNLPNERKDALDAKLQAIPQAAMEQFTNDQLDKGVAQVGDVIGLVRAQNPAAADAILQDPALQLGIADYRNQFGSTGPQFIGYLAGNPQQLAGAPYRPARLPPEKTSRRLSAPRPTAKTPITRAVLLAARHISTKRWASSIWGLPYRVLVGRQTALNLFSDCIVTVRPYMSFKRSLLGLVIGTVPASRCVPTALSAPQLRLPYDHFSVIRA